MAPDQALPPFDPFGPEFRQTPYTLYRRYREREPVHWGGQVRPGVAGCWYLTRHADVEAAFKDPRLGREAGPTPDPMQAPPPLRPLIACLRDWMVLRDPPGHTRLRSPFVSAFQPRIIQQLRPGIEAAAAELLDRVEPKGGMDLIADYAFPLPILVIGELFGIPAADRPLLRRWAPDLVVALDMGADQAAVERGAKAVRQFSSYLKGLIKRRRHEPCDDLLSLLANDPESRLEEEELVANCILLLVAGHETTAHLIGNGVLALLQHPDQWDLLRQNRVQTVDAVEELLRYDTSNQLVFRLALQDLEIDGHAVAAGEHVCLVQGAANRDPAVYPDPERLDLRRTDFRHLSFGQGIHFCLGAALARLELEIAFGTLAARLPGLRLTSDETRWRQHVFMRGLESLPLAF